MGISESIIFLKVTQSIFLLWNLQHFAFRIYLIDSILTAYFWIYFYFDVFNEWGLIFLFFLEKFCL